MQTAGRGSRGRSWVAPPGNLSLSVLLRPATPAAESGIFSLLAGVAVAAAIQAALPAGTAAMLKWPNDVLLDGAKCAGVLIDAAPTGTGLDWLVIGIGVNLRHAPEIPGRRTATLAQHGAVLDAATFRDAVLGQLAHWLAILQNAGPAAICNAWEARAHRHGTPITVLVAGFKTAGTFAGLAASGALLLAHGGVIERIDTGEVLLGRETV